MNLIKDPWIPTDAGVLGPADVLLHASEIRWPRSDWNAMTHVFLAGLVQTAIVNNPKLCADVDSWDDLSMRPQGIADWFKPFTHAFELHGQRGFMQVDVASDKSIPDAAIIPNMPAENTLKKNADIFIHRTERPDRLTDAERAIALYTLSACGWSAGGGFLKNSRGGNALTTLILPMEPGRIWHMIWLNILSAEQWFYTYDETPVNLDKVFPWIDPEVRSVTNGKRIVTPELLHPLHVYWQMPMRQQWRNDELYHEKGGSKGGLSYADGGWRHPFTAYCMHNGANRPVPCDLNLGYHHWSPFILGGEASLPPLNIAEHINLYRPETRLWLFGWATKQAEALAWAEVTTPTILCARSGYKDEVNALLDKSKSMNRLLYAAVKEANVTARANLYAATETDWYRMLTKLVNGPVDDKDWLQVLRKRAFALYEELAGASEPMDYVRGLSVLRKTSR